MSTKAEIGKQRIKDIIGSDSEKILQAFNEISPAFAKYVVEFGYGDLYARPGIDDKTREVIAVSCLISQGNTGLPLKAHLKAMLNVGWSKQEVIEFIIFSAGFTGFPNAVGAIMTARDVFSEI